MHKHLLAMNELNAIPVSSATAPVAAAATATALATGSSAAHLTPLASPLNHMIKPMPVPLGLNPAGVTTVSAAGAVGTMFDGKALTTKIKAPPNVAAATMLATAVKKNGNKFSPY